MEKRSLKRHGIAASIACGHFTTSTGRETYGGEMLNYSDGGLCIQSRADFKKGALVLIHVRDIVDDAASRRLEEGFRSLSLGEIKWSKPLDDAGNTCFGMSVITY
jgi:hypothetical protein